MIVQRGIGPGQWHQSELFHTSVDGGERIYLLGSHLADVNAYEILNKSKKVRSEARVAQGDLDTHQGSDDPAKRVYVDTPVPEWLLDPGNPTQRAQFILVLKDGDRVVTHLLFTVANGGAPNNIDTGDTATVEETATADASGPQGVVGTTGGTSVTDTGTAAAPATPGDNSNTGSTTDRPDSESLTDNPGGPGTAGENAPVQVADTSAGTTTSQEQQATTVDVAAGASGNAAQPLPHTGGNDLLFILQGLGLTGIGTYLRRRFA